VVERNSSELYFTALLVFLVLAVYLAWKIFRVTLKANQNRERIVEFEDSLKCNISEYTCFTNHNSLNWVRANFLELEGEIVSSPNWSTRYFIPFISPGEKFSLCVDESRLHIYLATGSDSFDWEASLFQNEFKDSTIRRCILDHRDLPISVDKVIAKAGEKNFEEFAKRSWALQKDTEYEDYDYNLASDIMDAIWALDISDMQKIKLVIELYQRAPNYTWLHELDFWALSLNWGTRDFLRSEMDKLISEEDERLANPKLHD